MDEVGRLTRVPLREVWPHEALDFTTWLQENLDVLNEHLDVQLVSAEREKSTGNFNVDLLAEDQDGQTVVIENQLGRTDHDHLGKVLTYLAAFDADRVIWIAADPRPEHVKAVAWLNDSTPVNFHLFRVEAVRIGDSPPAPLLTPIVGPSTEGKRVAAQKKEHGARHQARLSYWTRVLELAADRTELFSTVNPGRNPYISTGAGVTGVSYQYWVTKNDARVVLWIDRGKDQGHVNASFFHQLEAHRAEVDAECGTPLSWEANDDARSSKLVLEIEGAPGWDSDPADWDTGMIALIDGMDRLEAALSPHVKNLDPALIDVETV